MLQEIQYFIYLFYIPFLFLSSVVLTYSNRETMRSAFKNIKKQTWIVLLLIISLGAALRVWFAPNGVLSGSDIENYLNAAGQYPSNPQGLLSMRNPAYSYILSMFLHVFGMNIQTVNAVSTIFGILSIFAIFVMSYIMFKNEFISLLSGLALSVFPPHIFYSGVAVPEIVAIFFELLLFSVFVLAVRSKNESLLWLAYRLLLIAILVKRDAIAAFLAIGVVIAVKETLQCLRSVDKSKLVAAAILGLPAFLWWLDGLGDEFTELSVLGFGKLQNILCFLHQDVGVLIFVPLLLFEFQSRVEWLKVSRAMLLIIAWFVFSILLVIVHWFPLGRYYLMVVVPLIVVASYGLAACVGYFQRINVRVFSFLIIILFLMPSFLVLKAGDEWYLEQRGLGVCLGNVWRSDEVVAAFAPFASQGTTVVAKNLEFALLRFAYPQIHAVPLQAFSERNFASNNSVYFIKYRCAYTSLILSSGGRAEYEDNDICDKIEAFSTEIILKANDSDGNAFEIHRLGIK